MYREEHYWIRLHRRRNVVYLLRFGRYGSDAKPADGFTLTPAQLWWWRKLEQ